MKGQSSLFPILLCLILSGCACYTNLSDYKDDLKRYHETRYNADIDAQIRKAEHFLSQKCKTPGKYALVLDIDETALSNWEDLTGTNGVDFGYNKHEFETWINTKRGVANPSVLRLAKEAQADGVTVFFITGRRDYLHGATEENLRIAGYRWEKVYYTSNSMPVAEYKTSCRKDIAAKGYEIILNVGDQWSDLNGGHADKCIKVPNPFYRIK
jgi:predicted secreted acid phosphatase